MKLGVGCIGRLRQIAKRYDARCNDSPSGSGIRFNPAGTRKALFYQINDTSIQQADV